MGGGSEKNIKRVIDKRELRERALGECTRGGLIPQSASAMAPFPPKPAPLHETMSNGVGG